MQALSRTCSASAALWLWPGQALYAGPSLDLGVHTGSVECLAVGVDAPIRVEVPGRTPVTARSVLIPPRLPHQVVAQGGQMVFCYLDAGSSYAKSCRAQMTVTDGPLSHSHRAETSLLRHGYGASWLTMAAPVSPGTGRDPRIHAATRRLLRNPESTVSARLLADEAGLSVSRFLHLFKAETGTSFRRYRLWSRMLRAAELIDAGHDLTRVAADAGFSSPSHLSSAFHGMFGLTPSRLLAVPLTIRRGDRSP